MRLGSKSLKYFRSLYSILLRIDFRFKFNLATAEYIFPYNIPCKIEETCSFYPVTAFSFFCRPARRLPVIQNKWWSERELARHSLSDETNLQPVSCWVTLNNFVYFVQCLLCEVILDLVLRLLYLFQELWLRSSCSAIWQSVYKLICPGIFDENISLPVFLNKNSNLMNLLSWTKSQPCSKCWVRWFAKHCKDVLIFCAQF